MQLIITRVGGMLPTLKPHRKYDFDNLDPATQAALMTFLHSAPDVATAPYPDRMSYLFEFDAKDQRLTKSAGYDGVPKLLQVLLPGPL